MEQREVDRLQTPAENQGRLVDPDKASGAEAHPDLAMFNLVIDSKLRGLRRGQPEGRRCGPSRYDRRSRHRRAEQNRTSRPS